MSQLACSFAVVFALAECLIKFCFVTFFCVILNNSLVFAECLRCHAHVLGLSSNVSARVLIGMHIIIVIIIVIMIIIAIMNMIMHMNIIIIMIIIIVLIIFIIIIIFYYHYYYYTDRFIG